MRLATAPREELDFAGGPATIMYRAKVVNVDVEEGIISLDIGEEIKSDLVVSR